MDYQPAIHRSLLYCFKNFMKGHNNNIVYLWLMEAEQQISSGKFSRNGNTLVNRINFCLIRSSYRVTAKSLL